MTATNTTELVVSTWTKVQAIDSYEEVAGEMLFKRIFEINPDASAFFKFTDGYETTDEALYKQELFKKHSTGVISNVTAAVGLLEKGDMDTLTTVLKELGQKHFAYGLQLQKAHYDLVGQALIDTLSTALGEDFTEDAKNAWVGVYDVIATTMMAGAAEFDENNKNGDSSNYNQEVEEEKKEDGPPQYYVDPNTLVVSSWDKIKDIENYKTVAGQLLFKRIFEINPDASAFFKFTDGYETTDEALYKQEIFLKHAEGVVSAVTASVDLLERSDMKTLESVLKELGAKHLSHGLNLEKAHYDLVGQALLDTLEKALGTDVFTPETKDAWSDVYGVITEKMMVGAAEFEEEK
eukprot:CAMPEP_0113461002 /NCGR_PEP_ID=MMETSP0014_2-20120614/11298_1 /TAXON_ID=2857 /ORGANISM="Nitzschia sp." /LENGTH=349 /DNA_ID=CAMNT_0000352713 /DNA_START=192 /DNA_END=1241 /DNA_ORIENTATION=- /assembly_acc=CAM_ASM_000159